ncbi:MAG: DUF2807 domain-containing protein [Flavobacteriales bacterium]|nr:DUF2807 domain-containing protein [Flavobacteriales bacterium]
MRLKLAIPGFLLLAASLQACTPLNCERGAGPVVKRTLTLSAFRGIAAQGSLEVRLTRGSAQAVEIEGQSNLIDLLITDVKGGVWEIGTKKCYNTDKPFIVHITMPMVDFVSVQGSGDVKTVNAFTAPKLTVEVQGSGEVDLGIDAKHIDAIVQGSGDIDLHGTCGDLNVTVQGSGDIDASDLEATNAEASVQGSGDIGLTVTGKLTANIGGSGNINYTGSPTQVNKHIAGSGEVKQLP